MHESRSVIEPTKRWQAVNWAELASYRDLLFFLVWRDIKVVYKQTVMGLAWALIRPVFGMLVFTVVFGRLAQIRSDGIPYALFSYTALVPWFYFSTALTKASNSLVTNRNLLTKVYFPRYVIPFTPILAGLLDFAISFALLLVMMIGYRILPTWAILYTPLLVLLMVVTAAGIGMWAAALAIRYRDIEFGMQFFVPLLMYGAPVVWPASLIAAHFPAHPLAARLLYGLYPMAGVIEGFRAALLGKTPMPWDLLATGTLAALALFLSGATYFRRTEDTFADVA